MPSGYDGWRPAIPTTFLIDEEGVVKAVWVGTQSEATFMAAIDEHLY